ncbi:MAG: hypothetical protein EOO22_27745, partial [Comamonadaceae bacterium]
MIDAPALDAPVVVDIRKLWTSFSSPDGEQVVHRDLDLSIRRGEGLAAHLSHRWRKNRPFTLAAAHRFSSHHLLLHAWLRRHGVQPGRDAEIVFLPPPLMPRNLTAGHIDGY